MTIGQFKIDNQTFTAKSIKPQYESLAAEDSGRTDDGVMHITWIRNNIRKYEIEMPPMSSQEASSILSAVQGKIYNLTIYDPQAASEVTVKCYTSNSNADLYSGVLYNGLWQGISFSAIEV